MESSTEQRQRLAAEADSEVRAARLPDVQVTRALLSVSDKTGIVEFARGLRQLGIEIVSTGGTATALSEAGVPVRSISDLTGFPEILDGRVKTLHPRLYAGLLALRDDAEHLRAVEDHEVEFIDLVCVNLYPFERTAARRGVSEREVIENIDIGGPTLIRAAAKNWRYVAPVTTPESYDAVLAELRESGRRLSEATRESLAAEAFAVTARYDAAIARWFQEKHEDFPPLLVRAYEKVLELPYGENPHQRAAYYTQVGARMHVLSMVSQLGGKQLSFNNLLDLNAARALLDEFQVPACVIVKHNNPCGVALGADALEAYQRAFEGDPLSAYGGVVCLNRRVERALAEALVRQFIEVLFAPGYDADALEVLQSKPNMRILDDHEQRGSSPIEAEFRQVSGGMLVQDRDSGLEQREEMKVVSARAPTDAEWSEALFAWKVCKHVRSNAIVLSSGLQTVGIGAGQMTRVDAVKIALEKVAAFWDTHDRFGGVEGDPVAMASDAFFPFPDSAELATAAGVTVVVEPGGSIRDKQVIEAVDRAGAAMIFTSRRHFRH
jgi:phosphoribosylaminoimidazolecarboxamide formyltransferase / IMP cyclohydrolase